MPALERRELLALVALLLGYPLAYWLATLSERKANLMLILVLLPFWTSVLVRIAAWIVLLQNNGLVNRFFMAIGLTDAPIPLLFNRVGVVVAMVHILLPFMILPLYAALEKLDRRLIEAAHDLGAGRVMIFRRVIIPLTLPGIIAGAMLTFLPALGMFYVADLLGGAKTMLVGNLIRDQFLAARDWPFGSAASAMLTGLMALLLWAYYQSSRRANRGALP